METIFHAESNDAGFKVRQLTVFKQRSFEDVEYANEMKLIQAINHAKSTVCTKFQFLVTFSSLFTASSVLKAFPRLLL